MKWPVGQPIPQIWEGYKLNYILHGTGTFVFLFRNLYISGFTVVQNVLSRIQVGIIALRQGLGIVRHRTLHLT